MYPSGRRHILTDAAGATITCFYDPDGRLTHEDSAGLTPAIHNAYAYDPVGNRTSLNGSVLTYDADDRLTSGGHSYDGNGNELLVNGVGATYDFENHLVRLGTRDYNAYTYDADGNRLSVATRVGTPSASTTSYLVDPQASFARVVLEYQGATYNAVRSEYGDDLLCRGGYAASSFYLYDGLGSVRQLTDGGGSVTDGYLYDAFGVELWHTGSSLNPFMFQGQQFDAASGTYYLRARYYDQNNGRFISQDPFGGSNDDPVSLHRYLYAGDDPVDNVDPGGEFDFSISSVGTALGTAFTIGAALYSAYAFYANPSVLNGLQLALAVIPGEGLLSVVGRLAAAAKVGRLANLLDAGIKGTLTFSADASHMVDYLRGSGVSRILFNEASLKALREDLFGTIQGKKVLDGVGYIESTGKTILAEAKPAINGSDLVKTKQKFEDTYELLKEAASREGHDFNSEQIEELVVVYKSKSGLPVNAGGYVKYGDGVLSALLDGKKVPIRYQYHP